VSVPRRRPHPGAGGGDRCDADRRRGWGGAAV